MTATDAPPAGLLDDPNFPHNMQLARAWSRAADAMKRSFRNHLLDLSLVHAAGEGRTLVTDEDCRAVAADAAARALQDTGADGSMAPDSMAPDRAHPPSADAPAQGSRAAAV